MYLITKNKIADYIQQHPEARTAVLTWIKEYPYYQAKSTIEGRHMGGIIIGSGYLGRGDYGVKYKFNPWVKTGYLTWLGSKDEEEDYNKAEHEKMKIQYPDLKVTTFTATTKIRAPKPHYHATTVIESKPDNVSANLQEVFPSKIEDHIVSELDFKTKAQYEKALNRAIAIFDARPGTPEFDDLASLLPLIRHYEASNIELPRLVLLDAIKLKMQMLDLAPSYLNQIIGTEQETALFLAGKNTLIPKKLQAVCNKLYIRIPLNDNSLIK